MTLRLAPAAGRDIEQILAWSDRNFGATARGRYSALIAHALRAITDADPPTSRDATEIGPGLRLYHLRNSRIQVSGATVGKPRHLLVYRRDGNGNAIVLRLLHDATDLTLRVDSGN